MKLRIVAEIVIFAVFLIAIPIVSMLGRNVAVSADSAGTAKAYIQRGDQFLQEGRLKFNNAAIQYWEAIKRDPGTIDAHFKLAQIYYEYIWNYEALYELDEVKKINPNYPDLYLLIGKIYQRMEDKRDNAYKAFQRATSAQPEGSEAHYYLGTVHQQRNVVEDAIKEYETAINVWTSAQDKEPMVKSYLQLGRIYKDKKNLEKAVDQLKRALSADPGSVEIISELNNIYEQEAEDFKRQRKYDEAARKYEEILKIDPDNPDNIGIYMELGNIYRSEQLYDKAIDIYTKVTKLDSLNFDAFTSLKELKVLKDIEAKNK